MSSQTAPSPPISETQSRLWEAFVRVFASGYAGVLLTLAALLAVLSLTTGTFATGDNASVLARGVSVTILVGLAQMVVIGAGGLNLSIGATGGIVAVLTGALLTAATVPVWLAVVAALGAGIACGVLNGLVIGYGRQSPFIVTLATGSLFTGFALAATESKPYGDLPPGFVAIGESTLLGVPTVFVIALIAAAVVWGLFRYVRLGRQLLAVGASPQAAELAGVRTARVQVAAYALSGLLAAAAALLLVARLGSAGPNAGSDWLLLSFAVPIIGGTRLSGGSVSVLGTVLGAFLLGTLANGLVHWNVDVYFVELISGVIILLAAGSDRLRQIVSDPRRFVGGRR